MTGRCTPTWRHGFHGWVTIATSTPSIISDDLLSVGTLKDIHVVGQTDHAHTAAFHNRHGLRWAALSSHSQTSKYHRPPLTCGCLATSVWPGSAPLTAHGGGRPASSPRLPMWLLLRYYARSHKQFLHALNRASIWQPHGRDAITATIRFLCWLRILQVPTVIRVKRRPTR